MKRRPLRLFWSQGSGKAGGPRNAGDWYSPLLCERLSGRRVEFAPVPRCDLVAVGSLLDRLHRTHRLHRLGFRRSLRLWGTGTLYADDRLLGQHEVFALRGVRTRERVVAAAASSVPLGDPGLLAGELLQRRPQRRHGLSIVVHQVHDRLPLLRHWLAQRPTVKVLSATLPVLELLEGIAASEVIWSTSLHGLIFADALEVPNRWLELPGLDGGRFKFDDYYSAFGCREEPLTLTEASVADPVQSYHRPGLDMLKAALLASFPPALL